MIKLYILETLKIHLHTFKISLSKNMVHIQAPLLERQRLQLKDLASTNLKMMMDQQNPCMSDLEIQLQESR